MNKNILIFVGILLCFGVFIVKKGIYKNVKISTYLYSIMIGENNNVESVEEICLRNGFIKKDGNKYILTDSGVAMMNAVWNYYALIFTVIAIIVAIFIVIAKI